MNTISKFPASKLPAELRGEFSGDTLVTVTIADENDLVWDYTPHELHVLLETSIQQKAEGRGIICTSAAHIDEFFDGIRARVDRKYKTL